MKLNWSGWLYGLVSGFIGGGAASVGSGFAGVLTDPEHFSPVNGLHHLFVLMGTTFLISGVLTGIAYLSKSPLPPPENK